jgi:hypothetical protein
MVTTKKAIPRSVASKIPGNPAHPLYGRPIRDVIARGNVAEMKKMATIARKHIQDVQSALTKLEAKLKQSGS